MEEAVKRAAECVEKDDTPLEGLRGDAALVQRGAGPDPDVQRGPGGNERLPDKEELWHARVTERVRGWFFAMIHHIFGLQVAPVRVDVGALSPEVKIKKIHGVAVLRDDLGHGNASA